MLQNIIDRLGSQLRPRANIPSELPNRRQDDSGETTLKPRPSSIQPDVNTESAVVPVVEAEVQPSIVLSRDDIKTLDIMMHVHIINDARSKFSVFDHKRITEGDKRWAWYLYRAVDVYWDKNPILRQLHKKIISTLGPDRTKNYNDENLAKIFIESISNLNEAFKYFSGETSREESKQRFKIQR